MAITVGIDLTDDYIAVFLTGEESAVLWPAVICREKKSDDWYIGEEAYRKALNGQGVMTDRLLKLLKKDGTSTINHKVYRAQELLSKLIGKVLEDRLKTTDFSVVDRVAICLHEPEKNMMDQVAVSAVACGIDREKLILTSHEEAFLYYVLSCDRDIYSSMTCLFDLSSETLSYYEFMVVRGVSRQCAVSAGEDIPEAFHTDILNKDSGRTLGDRIITDVAKRHMEGKLFSGVFLTGSGFERTDWAPSFIDYVCKRRRVMLEKGLFAIGASLMAKEALKGENEPPYLVFCNTRTTSEISAEVTVGERKSKLILCPAGERWYGMTVHVELLPKDENHLDFTIEPFDRNKEKRVQRAVLDTFPERPAGTTRVAVDLSFENASLCSLVIRDMGFGELFPASEKTIYEEFET